MVKNFVLFTFLVLFTSSCNLGVSTYYESSSNSSELRWQIYFGSDFGIDNADVNFRGDMERLVYIQKIDKEDVDYTVYKDKNVKDVVVTEIFDSGNCKADRSSYSVAVNEKECNNSSCSSYSHYRWVDGDSLFQYGWPCETNENNLNYLVSSKKNQLEDSGFYGVTCEVGDFIQENRSYLFSVVCSMEDNKYFYRRKDFFSNDLDRFNYFNSFP